MRAAEEEKLTSPAREKTSSNFRLDDGVPPPPPMDVAKSPFLNKHKGLDALPGKEELALLIGHVKYMQIKRDIPKILSVGSASGQPGETDFHAIKTEGLQNAIASIKELDEGARELADLKLLVSAVSTVKEVRQKLNQGLWDECQEVVTKSANDGLVKKLEGLKNETADTVKKELEHAKRECVHQHIKSSGTSVLSTGCLTGVIGETDLNSIDIEPLKEVVKYASEAESVTKGDELRGRSPTRSEATS